MVRACSSALTLHDRSSASLKVRHFSAVAWRKVACEADPALAATSNQPPEPSARRARLTPSATRFAAATRRPSGRRSPSAAAARLAGRSALVRLDAAGRDHRFAGRAHAGLLRQPAADSAIWSSYRPSTTTDLYDRKGRIIGSFALERREVVGYDGFAPVLRQAVISIEDKNFESHWGINVFRVAGAAWHDIRSHGRAQGASTLTMQLARNLFLSSDRTAMRKIQEAYLAIQIERAFTKQQIFTLYGNQIYLGSGKYGFEAASEYFFSKHAKDLTLTEAALLAGLPKGPVAFSPMLNPDRALQAPQPGAQRDGVGRRDHPRAGGRGAQRPARPAHRAARESLLRRGSRKRCGASSKSALAPKRCMRPDCAWIPRSISTCSRRPIAPWSTAWPRTSAATDGAASSKTFSLTAATLDDYRHPDWAVAAGPGDYVHALVTRVLPLEIHARIGPPGSPAPRLCCCRRTGSGPASATATPWSSPATLSMSI